MITQRMSSGPEFEPVGAAAQARPFTEAVLGGKKYHFTGDMDNGLPVSSGALGGEVWRAEHAAGGDVAPIEEGVRISPAVARMSVGPAKAADNEGATAATAADAREPESAYADFSGLLSGIQQQDSGTKGSKPAIRHRSNRRTPVAPATRAEARRHRQSGVVAQVGRRLTSAALRGARVVSETAVFRDIVERQRNPRTYVTSDVYTDHGVREVQLGTSGPQLRAHRHKA